MGRLAKQSKVLIIDCGIAQAAGPEDATHPTSKHCRDFLMTVLDVCHRVGMSPEGIGEWKRHRSRFATKWLVSMHARKKVVTMEISADSVLREALLDSAGSDVEGAAMAKDAHLLEAAIHAEQRVASLDERVRLLFAKAAGTVPELRKINWVNPDTEFEETQDWLKAGAPSDQRLLL